MGFTSCASLWSSYCICSTYPLSPYLCCMSCPDGCTSSLPSLSSTGCNSVESLPTASRRGCLSLPWFCEKEVAMVPTREEQRNYDQRGQLEGEQWRRVGKQQTAAAAGGRRGGKRQHRGQQVGRRGRGQRDGKQQLRGCRDDAFFMPPWLLPRRHAKEAIGCHPLAERL